MSSSKLVNGYPSGEPHLVSNCSAAEDAAMREGEQAWPMAKVETGGVRHGGDGSFDGTAVAG
jgi:hypothetical protein